MITMDNRSDELRSSPKNNDEHPDSDLSISINMDMQRENAVFLIEMPDNWDTKVIKRKETENDFDFKNRSNSQQLNVEIQMLLCKEDPRKSKICANINAEKVNVTYKAPTEIPRRYDFRYQLPNIAIPSILKRKKSMNEMPTFAGKENSPPPDANDAMKTNGTSKKLSFPTIKMPSFKKEKSSYIYHHNVSTRSTPPSSPKRHDFRYKCPVLIMPCFSTSKVIDDDETDTQRESKTESANKRYDFRYQLPTIEIPTLASKESSPKIEVNADQTASPTSRFDIFNKLPKIELPTIDYPTLFGKQKSPNPDTDVNLNLDPDVRHSLTDDTPTRYDFRYQLPKFDFPKIELPNLFSKDNTGKPEPEIENNVSLQSSKCDPISDDVPQRYDFRYQLPIFQTKDPSGDVSPDFNMNSSNFNRVPPPIKPPITPQSRTAPKYNMYEIRRQLSDLKKSRPSRTLPLNSLPEQDIHGMDEPLQFSLPTPRRRYLDEHSDIDLYPSPYKYISLPHFSPLPSVPDGRHHDPTSSEVGSAASISAKPQHNQEDPKRKRRR